MRVKLINAYTGTEMFVDDGRIEEYKAAGHILAASDAKTDEEKPVKKKTVTKKK